jgi:hypothetical protein
MKIKIKTASESVRFTPAIIFRRPQPRVSAVKPDHGFTEEIRRRKNPKPAIFF